MDKYLFSFKKKERPTGCWPFGKANRMLAFREEKNNLKLLSAPNGLAKR